jgi:PleD family two-component response regulator
MRSSFRFHDRLYRFGGEEFVVLMRLRQRARRASVPFERLRINTEGTTFRRSARSRTASASRS